MDDVGPILGKSRSTYVFGGRGIENLDASYCGVWTKESIFDLVMSIRAQISWGYSIFSLARDNWLDKEDVLLHRIRNEFTSIDRW